MAKNKFKPGEIPEPTVARICRENYTGHRLPADRKPWFGPRLTIGLILVAGCAILWGYTKAVDYCSNRAEAWAQAIEQEREAKEAYGAQSALDYAEATEEVSAMKTNNPAAYSNLIREAESNRESLIY